MALPTLLLTRPAASAEAFLAALDPVAISSVRILMAPLMCIFGNGALPDLEDIAGVIFTSANGVRHAPEGMGRPAFCVGAQTTQCAIDHGWNAQFSGRCSQELIATLLTARPAAPLLHLGGEHTIGGIAQTLTAGGIQTDHMAIYRQQLLPLNTQAQEALLGPVILPVFSPRTAEQLVAQAKGKLELAHIIALSDSVAAPFVGGKVAQCIILPSPQVIYMRKAVENLCLDLSLS